MKSQCKKVASCLWNVMFSFKRLVPNGEIGVEEAAKGKVVHYLSTSALLLIALPFTSRFTVRVSHVVEFNGEPWRWNLAFRDALRVDAVLRADYQRMKEQAVALAPEGRAKYNELKHAFIEGVKNRREGD